MIRNVQNIFNALSHQERKKFVLLSIADLCIQLLDLLFLAVLLLFVHAFTSGESNQLQFFISDWYVQHQLLALCIFAFLYSCKNAVGFWIASRQYRYVYEVATRMSKDRLQAYLEGSFDNFVHTDSSVYLYKISQQPIEFAHYVLNGLQQIISQICLIVFSLVAIFIYSPKILLLLTILFLPAVVFATIYMKRKAKAMLAEGKIANEKTIQHLQEAISGYVESNIYQRNEFFTNRYTVAQSKQNKYLSSRLVLQSIPSRWLEVFVVVGFLLLVWVHSMSSGAVAIDLLMVGAFIAAAYKVIPGMVKLINVSAQIKAYAYTIQPPNVLPDTIISSNKVNPIQSIVFENVSFAYKGEKVLRSFSTNIQKGDFISITGASGKGKSTFANLLLGFLTPESGQIYFNDRQCTVEEIKKYWGRIAYVKQQPFFIHDSILQNIKLHDNGFDLKRMHDLSKRTGISAFSMLDALQDTVAEQGKNLSGGQRQRIAFTRALYKEADVILLDEPFNELDKAAEFTLLQELKTLASQGKIILLITHQLAANEFCNKQIIMNGK